MSRKLYGLMADDGAAMLGTAEELGREILKRQGLGLMIFDSSYIIYDADESEDDDVDPIPIYQKPWSRRKGESMAGEFSRAFADVFWKFRDDGFFDIDNGKQILAFLPYDSVLDSVSAREVRENELDTCDALSIRRYVYDRATERAAC